MNALVIDSDKLTKEAIYAMYKLTMTGEVCAYCARAFSEDELRTALVGYTNTTVHAACWTEYARPWLSPAGADGYEAAR